MDLKKTTLLTFLIGINTLAFGANTPTNKQKKDQKNNNAYLGDKLPPNNNANRFTVDLSFIYWQAQADNLEYGLARDGYIAEDTIILPSDQKGGAGFSEIFSDRKMDFKWDPGFKLGFGVIFGEKDEWDLLLNWTWLKSTAKNSFTGVPELNDLLKLDAGLESPSYFKELVPSWSPVALGGPAVQAKSDWNFHYNTLDLELGRNFFLLKTLTLRPHIGVRAASLHQNINSYYNSILNTATWALGGVPIDEVTSFSPYSRFKGKNDFDGVGIRGGFDVNWNFTDHFAFYGKISASILWGKFSVYENFNSQDSIVTSDLDVSFIPFPVNFTLTDTYDETIIDNFHAIRTNIQTAIGVTWHTDFNNDKQHLFISLGYEFNEWFNQNQFRNLYLDPPGNLLLLEDPTNIDFIFNSYNKFGRYDNTVKREGDIGLQGLTFDVTFDF